MSKTVIAIGEFSLDSSKAHAINTIKTAGGFSRLGWRTVLLCRRESGRDPINPERLLDRFGESHRIAVRVYPGPDYPVSWREVPEWSRGFAGWCRRVAVDTAPDLVYARSYAAPVVLAEEGFTTVVESHAHPGAEHPMLQPMIDAAGPDGSIASIITIAPSLRQHFIDRGACETRVTVVPDGVDVDMFSPSEGGEQPSQTMRTAVYTGSLGEDKGVRTLIDAAPRLADIGVQVRIVGGTAGEIDRYDRAAGAIADIDLHHQSHVPLREVPRHLHSASVLILPNSSIDPSAEWTSPVKLSEYLATGKPIVAANVPGVARWVDEDVVHFFRPDDARSLAEAVRTALGQSDDAASRRSRRARLLADRYSYTNRATQILSACSRSQRLRLEGKMGISHA